MYSNILFRLLLSVMLSVSFLLPADAKPRSKPKPKVDPVLEQQVLEILRKNPEVLFEILKKYAEDKQKAERALALREFFKNSQAIIGSSPTIGSASNKILLVEFVDFQDVGAIKANEVVEKFMAKHKDKVTRVFKHFPLTQIHPQALPAAKAAWAAHKQGKFWEYHDALLANQSKLGEALYLETAKQLKLDIPKFGVDYDAANDAILNDFTMGRRLDVQMVPTFFLDSSEVTSPVSLKELESILAKAEKKK
jgi:protein-disulfide isomerase